MENEHSSHPILVPLLTHSHSISKWCYIVRIRSTRQNLWVQRHSLHCWYAAPATTRVSSSGQASEYEDLLMTMPQYCLDLDVSVSKVCREFHYHKQRSSDVIAAILFCRTSASSASPQNFCIRLSLLWGWAFSVPNFGWCLIFVLCSTGWILLLNSSVSILCSSSATENGRKSARMYNNTFKYCFRVNRGFGISRRTRTRHSEQFSARSITSASLFWQKHKNDETSAQKFETSIYIQIHPEYVMAFRLFEDMACVQWW